MADLIEELYRQNEWATLRLLEVCRGLDDRQLDAAVEGTYGSIRETLVHLVAAEPSYVRRLGGTYDGPAITYDAFPGFDALEAATRASATGLIERARAALAAAYSFQSPQGETIDAEVVLAQVLNHATEHRAHVCTILTTLGVQPPALDGWSWGEATGRIRPAG